MNAIIFCGTIGSGKTSVAKEVARLLNAPRVSFGDYLRRVAGERGLDTANREVLQDLGLEFIKDPRAFCAAVLSQASDWRLRTDLVIDGVRHAAALDALRQLLSSANVLFVYMEPPPDALEARRAERGDDPTALSHPVEQEITSLRELADVIVNEDEDPEKSAVEVVSRLSRDT
jgi:cytidylate kinase